MGSEPSILDVPRLLYDGKLRQALIESPEDPELLSFWLNDITNNRGNESNEVTAWIASKFTTFAGNRVLKAMLSTGADSFDPS